MIRIIHFFVGQRLFVNLLVFIIFLIGGFVLLNTNREAFPNVNFDMVTVTTLYPGASPDEIEQLITIPIEKKLREVNNLDKVRSYNIENVSVIVVYLDPDAADKRKIVDDVKDAVDSIDNLPDNSELPVIEEITFDKTPAIDIALTVKEEGDEAYRKLRNHAKNLEDYLYDQDGVAEVERFGYREREFLVEIDPEQLNRNHLGLNSVTDALRRRNFNLPGGVLRLGDQEYLLRTRGQFKDIQEVSDTVVRANFLGMTRLKNVAEISDTFEEEDIRERFNRENAIILKVWKKETADMIDLTDRIKSALAKFPTPEGISVTGFNDYSRFVRQRLSSLIVNGVIGFILLAVILVVLLGPRISGIVGMSIPLSFMVAFIGMKTAGLTINVITMFALVMVLGMIVDFSIVVAENSYRHMERGESSLRAVERGTAEVFWPVSTTLLCICAAFFPLLYMTGIVGKFVRGIPMVIMLCLAASWFAAMFILPSHLETFARAGSSGPKGDDADRSGWLLSRYRRTLGYILDNRYKSLGALGGVFFAALLIAGTLLGFVFFPGGGAEGILIRTRMPQGTTLSANIEAVRQLEAIAAKLPESELESMHSRVGVEIANLTDPAPSEGTHRGTLILHLSPVGSREREAEEIMDQLRQATREAKASGGLTESLELDFRAQQGGPPVGLPVNVEIWGRDLEQLETIAGDYVTYLKTLDGVYDVSIDLEPGKEEYRFIVDEAEAARAEVSVMQAAMTLRTAFDGSVPTVVNEGEDEIDVRVRFTDEARRDERSLSAVRIDNSGEALIPLSRIARYERQSGYAMINRLNFRRVIQVQANVNTDKITSVEVNQRLEKQFADLVQRYPGYSVNYGGEEEDRQKSMTNLMILFLFALVVIYVILSSFFKSLILPVIVMSAIPFGLVGVVLALLAHFKPLSFMSVLGVVSLAGVIVSNTLVLVQFINYLRAEGKPLREALIEGGAIRLRPVLLTSLTTVLGLIPTVYGLGGEDAFVAPLALAFGYGLIFATFITLLLIPCFYMIAEDFKILLARLLGRFGVEISPSLFSGPSA